MSNSLLPVVLEHQGEEGAGRDSIYLKISVVDPREVAELGVKALRPHAFGMYFGPQKEFKCETVASAKIHGMAAMLRTGRYSGLLLSSYQIQNTDLEIYPGGIVIRANIPELGGEVILLIAVSGLIWQADEAFCVELARQMTWGLTEHYGMIMGASSNHVLARVLDAVA